MFPTGEVALDWVGFVVVVAASITYVPLIFVFGIEACARILTGGRVELSTNSWLLNYYHRVHAEAPHNLWGAVRGVSRVLIPGWVARILRILTFSIRSAFYLWAIYVGSRMFWERRWGALFNFWTLIIALVALFVIGIAWWSARKKYTI